MTAAFFSSTLFNPRTWNGTWYYFIGNATYGTFGRGCAHASGTPTLAAAPGSLPRLGGTFTLQLGNLDPLGRPALLAIGLDNTTSPLGALPLGLAFLGAPGCELLVDPATNLLVLNQSGSGTVVTGIPNNAAFVGVALYHQGLVLSAGANALNAVVTNGGEGFLGN